MTRTPLQLPEFEWDSLAEHAARARSHPDGFIDLSVGSPVDDPPMVARDALAHAADSPGYPQTIGSPELRAAIVEWYARRRGVDDLALANVLPTIGSKEFVGLLPTILGLGAGDVVVHPTVAYPTYGIGAAVAGARVVASDDPADWPAETRLVWVNSPGNPTGSMASVDFLRGAVARARELGAVIASDECYAEFAWEAPAVSILHPDVIEGERNSVLALYSLSKQSNMAGYRAALVAGCSDLIAELLAVRRHIGLIPPAPIQAAMTAALTDDVHVTAQRERYRMRRSRLTGALNSAGYRVDDSEGGIYLWATTGAEAWETVAQFADLGILVAPGSFWGENPAHHVRIALTATDHDIADAANRVELLA